jgi:hypothetical protein
MKRIELYPRGSDNRYIIVADQDRFLKLECVWFCGREVQHGSNHVPQNFYILEIDRLLLGICDDFPHMLN